MLHQYFVLDLQQIRLYQKNFFKKIGKIGKEM